MVEATGFEPTTSASRISMSIFFDCFYGLFEAFQSENGAFGCSRSHCFHVVQVRRWSNMWSKSFRNEAHSVRYSNRSPSVKIFFYRYYNIYLECWQQLSLKAQKLLRSRQRKPLLLFFQNDRIIFILYNRSKLLAKRSLSERLYLF